MPITMNFAVEEFTMGPQLHAKFRPYRG